MFVCHQKRLELTESAKAEKIRRRLNSTYGKYLHEQNGLDHTFLVGDNFELFIIYFCGSIPCDQDAKR